MRAISLLIVVSFLWTEVFSNIDITPIDNSPGLYYEQVGDVSLSNNNWEFVTYVNYSGYLLFYKYLHVQADKLYKFCQVTQQELCTQKLKQVSTNLNIIAENERITSGLLGLDAHQRSKRSWDRLFQFGIEILPYFLRPLGDKFASFVYGERQSGPDMEMYERQLQELGDGQNEIRNLVYEHATMFKADSELKADQIEKLNRVNDETKDQLKMLRATAEADSQEKAQQIKDLQELLEINTRELKRQEEVAQQQTRDIESIKNFMANMTAFAGYLESVTKNNTIQIDKVKALAELNSLMSDFNFIFSNYIRDQEQFLQIVEKANRGVVDPRVITPMKLMNLMQEAGAHLPEGSTFPYHPSLENSMKLYRLIDPVVYRYNYTLVFKFRMKLVQRKKFSLYKIATVPAPIGSGKFVFVLPKNPFLLLDRDEDQYALMSENRYRTSCLAASTSEYICSSTVTESTADTNLPCDVGIFIEKEITSKCDVRLMHLDEPIFLQLVQSNSWIYVTPSPVTVIFKSGDARMPETLDGVGVLKLTSHETAVLGTTVLSFTPDKVYFEVSQLHRPTISLLGFVDKSHLPELDEETLNAKPKRMIPPFDYKDLEECSVRIRGNVGGRESSLDMVQFVIVGIVVVGTIVLVMLIMFKNNYFHCPFRKFDDETHIVQYGNVKA